MAPDDPIELWQSQTVETTTMSLEDLRYKSARFESCIRARNRRETIASIFTIGIFGFYLYWFPTPLARAGSILTIAGVLYMIYQINRRGAPAHAPADAGFETCVAFRRHELERHRDLLRSVWSWYLGPIIPGLVVFFAGALAAKIHNPVDWWKAVPVALVTGGALWTAAWLNHRWADRLQRQIDELDRLTQ